MAAVLLSEALARWRGMFWTLGRARKRARCWVSDRWIESGDEVWRPLSNGADRMRRVLRNELPAPADSGAQTGDR